MTCEEFEEFLTDYLDGFLPAPLFHRWERHAVLCARCTELPGEVVRAIGTCYIYLAEEKPVPVGLNERILQATLGTELSRRDSSVVWRDEWLPGCGFGLIQSFLRNSHSRNHVAGSGVRFDKYRLGRRFDQRGLHCQPAFGRAKCGFERWNQRDHQGPEGSGRRPAE